MRYIGINPGFDGGVAVFNSSGVLEFYAQQERYGDRSRHSPLADLSPIFKSLKLKDDDFVVVAQPTFVNPALENISSERLAYSPSLARAYKPLAGDGLYLKSWFGQIPHAVIDHHLAHAIGVWCYRPDDRDRLFVVGDHMGIDTYNKPKTYLVGNISIHGFSVCDQTVDIPGVEAMNRLLGPGSLGRALGLISYYGEQWTADEILAYFLDKAIDRFNPDHLLYPQLNPKKERDLIFAANFCRSHTNLIWEGVQENIDRFARGNGVVVAGSMTLIPELNTKIHQHLGGNVVMGPCGDDSGVALGAAAFAYYHCTGVWPTVNTVSVNALQTDLPDVGRQNPTELALRLASGKIIGLLRGRAEIGTRALGCRSIFAAAEKVANFNKINDGLKDRDSYRALHPVVTEEQFDDYFVGPRGKFMEYRVACTEKAVHELPVIVQKDGSARPQVVSRDEDPWLHELLCEFGRLTGHECLVNTSLNAKGRSLCNTFKDAVDDMRGRGIEIVSVATKKDK